MKREKLNLKKAVAFLSAILLFITAFPCNSLASNAAENSPSFEQFVTDIKITDKDGKPFSESNPASKGADVNVEWKFSISPEQQKEILKKQDAIYELKCPEKIYELIKEAYDKSVTENWTEIREGGNQGVGFKYRPLANGLVQIQFENLDQGGNISGSFKMKSKINSDYTQGVKEIQVTINGKVIDIPLYIPKTSDISIGKSGYYDADTNEIKWSIKVHPQNEKESLSGVVVTDTIDIEKQVMQENTKVYCDGKEIKVSFKRNENNVITGFEYKFPENTTAGSKEITFSTTPMPCVFAHQNSNISVPNYAEAEKDGIVVKADAKVSVHTNFIQKDTGTDVKDEKGEEVEDEDGYHFIDYKVTLNSNNIDFGELTLTDNLPIGTQYVDNSLVVKYAKSNEIKHDVEVSDDHKNPETLSIKIGKVDKQCILTYRIKYIPKDAGDITEKYVNGTKVKVHSLRNIIEFYWNGIPYVATSTHEYIPQPGKDEFAIKKTGSAYYGNDLELLYKMYNLSDDNKDNIIKWTVTLGSEGSVYEDGDGTYKFKDSIPVGLQYIMGTLNSDMGGLQNVKYENNVLSCSIPSPVKGGSKITFLTKVVDTKPGVINDSRTHEKCDHGFILDSFGVQRMSDGQYYQGWPNTTYFNTAYVDKNKSDGEVDYDVGKRILKSGTFDWQSQKFEWTVDLNTLEKDHSANKSVYMKNPGLKDVLPEGHTLSKNDDGQYEVYAQKYNNNNPDGEKIRVGDSKSEWDLSYDEATRTLKINWKKSNSKDYITSRYKFNIKTKLTDKKKEEFEKGTNDLTSRNTVWYSADNVKEYLDSNKATADATIKHIDVISKGLGDYKSGTTIPWKIIVNQNVADNILKGATVEDQLADGLLLDTSSIHIFEAIRHEETFVKGKELVSDAIKLEYDANTNKVVFRFTEDIPRNKAFMIEFNTVIENNKITSVSNDAVFKGKYNETYTTPKVTVEVKYDGDIHSERSSINVKKHGENNEMLQGAEFTLKCLDYDGSKAAKTDKTGYAQFIDYLIPGFRYSLKETKAPKGYYLNDQEIRFTAGSTENGKVEVKQFKDILRAVKLKKTDEKGKVLSGAVFELYNDKDTKISGFTKKVGTDSKVVYYYDGKGKDELTSDTDGYVRVKGLDAGNYYFKEVKAPEGYVKSDKKYSFTLSENIPDKAKNSLEYYVEVNYDKGQSSVVNKKAKKVNFEFTKIDGKAKKPLKDAEFKLYKKICEDSSHNHDDVNDDMNSSCWKYIGMSKSDKDGKVKFANLEYGSYRLIETKAPDGYTLPDGCWNIEVTGDGKIIIKAIGTPPAFKQDKNIYKLPNFKKTDMPDMGGFGGKPFIYIGLAGTLSGLFVMIKRKKLLLKNKN